MIALLMTLLIFLYYVSYYYITHWSFSLIIIVEKSTTIHDILEQLIPIDSRWRELGNSLRLSSNYLDELAQSNITNQIRLERVLQKWIDLDSQESPVNWKTIIDVVEGPLVQNKALAMKMYQDLKQKASKQQSIPIIFSPQYIFIMSLSQVAVKKISKIK